MTVVPCATLRGGARLRRRRALRLCTALATLPTLAFADDLTSLRLDQLLEVPIFGASKYQQTQAEVAAAVSVITRAEIRTFGWRTLGEALASLPGVHMTGDRQYSYIGIRGFGVPGDLNTRVLVMIDGNRVNDPTYDSGTLGREFPVDIDLIERIEFIPGPGGAVYGQNAMFGVVNVITRTGAEVDGAEVSLAAQRPQRLREGRASWGARLDNGVDVLVSASGMLAGGENREMDYGASGISGLAAGLDGERSKSLFAHVARGPWSFELIYGDRRKDDPTGSYFSDPLTPGQYTRDTHTLVQLQYDDTFANDTLQASGRLFSGRYLFRSLLKYGGSDVTYPAEGAWRGTEWRLVSTAFAHHKLMVGLEVQQNYRTDQAVLFAIDPALDVRIPAHGYRAGVFGQDEWRMTDALTATLGLRVDHNDVTATQTSPRAALIWQVGTNSTLKALAGRARRAPNVFESAFGDGTSQAANPSLDGERVDTLELVADHRFGRELAMRASAYQWKMRDLVVLAIDGASGLPQYQSGEKITARGIELSADETWDFGGRLRGSLSLQDVTCACGGTQANSPKVLAKLAFSSPLHVVGARAGYELQYGGKRSALDGTRLGGYAVSNLTLTSDALARGVELQMSVYNLFDKQYRQPAADYNWQDAFEQDGRALRVRLSLAF